MSAAAGGAVALYSQGHDSVAGYDTLDFDQPAIRYSEGPVSDPAGQLNQRLEKGQVKLDYQTNGLGYLPSLLKNLGINPDSQALVFSKTSFQAPKISPARPRAVYFSDTAAVGFVQDGEVMEVMGLDPRQGYVFYTLQTKQAKGAPELVRRGIECLQCHLGPATLNVPGELVSSAPTNSDGSRAARGGAVATDHRVPLAMRWGGWYVTGISGSQTHRGNATVADPIGGNVDAAARYNVTSLAGRFNIGAYLQPTSDIVALMTLEHQTTMTNLITRLGWEARIARQENKLAVFNARMDTLAGDLVDYMTFAEESPLREPVKGVSTFTQTFVQRGPKDKQGRSLREFDLKKRLFRYPVSYMIYSQAFDSLPDAARDRVYKHLYDALTAKTSKLPEEDRHAALQIVRDTKTNLPSYWKTAQ